MLLPLHYHRIQVCHALIPRGLSLPGRWRLELPVGHLSKKYPPNVTLALLQEDELFRTKCTPTLTLTFGRRVLSLCLNRVVLSPPLQDLLTELFSLPRGSSRKESLYHDLATYNLMHPRVIHLNQNKLDCRLENLRELRAFEDSPHLEIELGSAEDKGRFDSREE